MAAWLLLALLPAQDGEADLKRRIDNRIQVVVKGGRRATSGLVKECIAETLAFGVPAYNAGDHDACARSYMRTAEALTAAFPAEAKSTPAGWRAIVDLKAGLERAAAAKDPDGRAWGVRYAFDKIQLRWESDASQIKTLMSLAKQNWAGGRYAEAADAYDEAAAVLNEVAGEDLSKVELPLRGAAMLSGLALLADGRYKEAARAVVSGLAMLPDFAKGSFDLKTQYRADRYDAILDGVKAAAEQAPDDADLAFLHGYVLHHSGRKDDAVKEFDRALRLAPKHPGVKYYREAPAPKQKDF
ncbi:MAG TPA: hypothetical protein VE981_24815 [Planctomycetota bacterium]|nr:hypothetical protein [Planctomycetota bacterium]